MPKELFETPHQRLAETVAHPSKSVERIRSRDFAILTRATETEEGENDAHVMYMCRKSDRGISVGIKVRVAQSSPASQGKPFGSMVPALMR